MSIIKCFNTRCPDLDLSQPDNCGRPLTLIKECADAVVKKEVKKSLGFYVDELRDNGCACGRTKKPGNTFCFRCFKALPREMQKALYKRIGQGYRAAREEARRWLEENGR